MKRKALAGIFALFLLLLVGCNQSQETAVPIQQQQYVGSINSDKYHYPSCEWAGKIKPENEIWFSTQKEAQQAKYKPCKICRP
mgnify:CR=1 FL=1